MRPFIALALSLILPSIVQANSWPQWRGPDRDGKAVGESMRSDWSANPPKLLWRTEGLGEGYASVAVQDGVLYTTGNTSSGQSVTAVDLNTHKIKWSTPLTSSSPKHGYPGSRCTPTLDGDRVYVVASDGQIACLSQADGSVAWKHAFSEWNGSMMSGWGFSESPLIDGDKVVFTPGGPDAMVVACNKLDGTEIWRCKSELSGEQGKNGAGYSSLVIGNAGGVKQYITIVGRGAIGVRAEDGKYLWGYNRVANPTANIPTAIPFDDQVFVSTGYNDGGAALLTLTARGDSFDVTEEYWKSNSELQNHHGGMIRIDDKVYFGNKHNKGFPVCVDLATGDLTWGGSIRGEGKGSAAITLVGDQLIFRYQDGTIAFVKATPEQYELLGTFRPEYQERESWSHPVVVDGVLYLREQNVLMAYDVK